MAVGGTLHPTMHGTLSGTLGGMTDTSYIELMNSPNYLESMLSIKSETIIQELEKSVNHHLHQVGERKELDVQTTHPHTLQ